MLVTDGGLALMGADTPPGMEHNPGDNIAVSLSGDDADDLRGYWEKLSDGAKVEVPLEKQMWGDEFGMCIDRFGITWMVNISASRGLSDVGRCLTAAWTAGRLDMLPTREAWAMGDL